MKWVVGIALMVVIFFLGKRAFAAVGVGGRDGVVVPPTYTKSGNSSLSKTLSAPQRVDMRGNNPTQFGDDLNTGIGVAWSINPVTALARKLIYAWFDNGRGEGYNPVNYVPKGTPGSAGAVNTTPGAGNTLGGVTYSAVSQSRAKKAGKTGSSYIGAPKPKQKR